MQEGILDRILETITSVDKNVIAMAIVAVVVLVVLVVVWKIFSGRKHGVPAAVAPEGIDVALLGDRGPPAAGPVLEHYNVPVRLAAIVLAPTGRAGGLPTAGELADLIDNIVPGLAQVTAAHSPMIRRWPPQLSAEGFARTVFAQVKLPGDGGKGSPWCSVAGRLKVGGVTFMAGLILRAAKANNFGQTSIDKEHEWLGVLRVKSG